VECTCVSQIVFALVFSSENCVISLLSLLVHLGVCVYVCVCTYMHMYILLAACFQISPNSVKVPLV